MSAQRHVPTLRSSIPALLLLAAAAAGAQSGRLDAPVCLFLPDGVTQEEQTIRLILEAELTTELRREGFPVVPAAAWRAAIAPGSTPPWEAPAAAVELARRVEAAVAVTASIRAQQGFITLGIRAYEAGTGAAICEIEQRSGRDIGLYNQAAALARQLGARLESWLESWLEAPGALVSTAPAGPPVRTEVPAPAAATAPGAVGSAAPGVTGTPAAPEPTAPEPPPPAAGPPGTGPPGTGLVTVTLLSPDEGAEIWLGAGSPVGTIRDGRLRLEAPAKSLLRVEKRKPGYHSDSEELTVAETPLEVPLRPLLESTRFAVELFYTSSQFLGLGAGLRLYLIPDYLALSAGHYSYFSLARESGDAEAAYHGDFRLTAGSYLLGPPGARLRFGLATGMGVIVSVFGIAETAAQRESYRDVYWEVLDLWLELNWGRTASSAVFLRAETRFALGLGGGVLERGFLSGYGPQYSLGWLVRL